jgi:putrescine transport system permease protein
MMRGTRIFLLPPLLWFGVFLLAPLLFVLRISFATAREAQPPYSPLLEADSDGGITFLAHLDNYRFILSDSLYADAYLSSLATALFATLWCLLIAWPIALAIARARGRAQAALLILVILPFWTSFLLRVYAWKVLLQGNGVVNAILLQLGIIDAPLALLYSPFAVQIGIVYAYLPFMVLPLYAALARQDPALAEAALDLGCPPWRVFLTVTLPLAAPGMVAGSLLVFVPAVGEFVIPELLGGANSLMIGRVLWTEFFGNRDWPVAAALAITMLLIVVVPVALLQSRAGNMQNGNSAGRSR